MPTNLAVADGVVFARNEKEIVRVDLGNADSVELACHEAVFAGSEPQESINRKRFTLRTA